MIGRVYDEDFPRYKLLPPRRGTSSTCRERASVWSAASPHRFAFLKRKAARARRTPYAPRFRSQTLLFLTCQFAITRLATGGGPVHSIDNCFKLVGTPSHDAPPSRPL